MNRLRTRAGIKGFAAVYAAIKEAVERGQGTEIREDEQPQWHDAAVVRLFKRLGAVPKSWSPQKAALRICIAAGEAVRSEKTRLESVFAVLKSFVAEQDGKGLCVTVPRCAVCPLRDRCAYVQKRPSLKDLPPRDRPRDRLLIDGAAHLSDAELLSLVLRDGTADQSALELSQKLLAGYGTFRRLAQRSVTDLCGVRGIGPAKATQIIAALEIARRFASQTLPPGMAFTSSGDVFKHFHEKMRYLKKEVFVLVMLDQKHRIIRSEPISEGSLTQSVVHPREVFKPAIAESAAAVIFVHNHPSGDPAPSLQDRELTSRLQRVGELIGIRVLDHVIIGSDRYVSFMELGLMEQPDQ